jgi:hypothetical protein
MGQEGKPSLSHALETLVRKIGAFQKFLNLQIKMVRIRSNKEMLPKNAHTPEKREK